MTMKSWRMVGKRSGTRSARSGLMKAMTSRLMRPAAKASRSNDSELRRRSRAAAFCHSASTACSTTYAPSRKTESLSLRLTSRLTVRLEIASVAASAATPSNQVPEVLQGHPPLRDPLLELRDLGRRDRDGQLVRVRAALGVAIRHASPGAGRRDGLARLLLLARRRGELAEKAALLLGLLLLGFLFLGRVGLRRFAAGQAARARR